MLLPLPTEMDETPSTPPPPNSAIPPEREFLLASLSDNSSASTISLAMTAMDRPKRTLKPIQPKSANFSLASSSIKGSWAASKILTPSSVITSPPIDLHTFLVTCISGFDSYTEEEKRDIIESLPPAYRRFNTSPDGKLECPIGVDFVMTDPFLKRAISKFKHYVAEGYYDPAWQAKAKVAVQERCEGKFDEYLKQHVEEMFGEDSENVNQDHEQGAASSGEGGGQNSVAHAAHDQDDVDLPSATSSDGEWVQTRGRKQGRAGRNVPT